jgi:hypothetical protein
MGISTSFILLSADEDMESLELSAQVLSNNDVSLDDYHANVIRQEDQNGNANRRHNTKKDHHIDI